MSKTRKILVQESFESKQEYLTMPSTFTFTFHSFHLIHKSQWSVPESMLQFKNIPKF